jgi:SAM-dependent methyltransferase
MFKFGIHKKEQLTPEHLDGFLNSRKFIALDLYNSLDEYPPGDRDRIQERMLCKFSNKNGTFRYTHARRFEDFDRLAVKCIRSVCPPDQAIRVHDVGASDGRTSCDFYETLSAIYTAQLRFVASDYAPFYYVVRRKHDARRLIVDERDNVLQIVTPPFVFNVVHPENKIFYPVNQVIRYLVNLSYVRSLLRAYKSGDANVERTRIDLLCSECRANCASKDNFRFVSYDIFSRPTDHFDVIRAMNVLNLVYFSHENLKKAIANIIVSLNEGGLLITGSNLEAGTVVNGGIYKKSGYRLEKVAISGSGSQVDDLIKAVSDEHSDASPSRDLHQCGISS